MEDDTPKAFQQTPLLRFTSYSFLAFWALIAAFPLFWIFIMSFKLPIDAFAQNPLDVILGDNTANSANALSIIDVLLVGFFAYYAYQIPIRLYRTTLEYFVPNQNQKMGAFFLGLSYILILIGFAFYLVPVVSNLINTVFSVIPLLSLLAEPLIGYTLEHYYAVWVENEFYVQFKNSLIVTTGVVTISLTVGTLAAYALSRTTSNIAIWLLITALVFRALPHSVLVTGYLPFFIESKEILEPLWGMPIIGWILSALSDTPPTLYGQPLAVIAVLVAINQPFTIWMLRSFFMNVPKELDEAARVDGCTHFQAFRKVILPVMWPGLITTGLFSFLLAYNDYLVTSLLLDNQNQTMVPAITAYFNRETTATDQVEAIAAATSITAPLFLLVMLFQKQIVSGLTAGAVKG
ncbi:carbohydrate ABC transporter permease [Marinomonas sp. 2405UD68-3]|uniref:carbohydrate ABC transporter permease n=1 Tax=Marinomonas sp. 2405UD68-3 TaxID=3391835 RepID=UPI0039C945C9